MPDLYGFDRETTVVPRDPGRYDGELHEGWRIGLGINGGLLLAVAGRALAAEFGGGQGTHGEPIAISGYYLSAARPGAVSVRAEALRRGRTLSTGTASVRQGDEERLRVLATYGDLGRNHADVRTSATPPQMPPPEECAGSETAPAGFRKHAPLLDRFELRLDPATAGWTTGAPSGRGLIQGWFRLPDGREPDPLALLLAVDALPPVSLDLGVAGWTPTLELTVHVRARPAPGWLRLKHSTRNFAHGYLEEDAEVWDSAGRLVAQSRQLARVRS